MQKDQYIHINSNGTKRYYSDKAMKVSHREDGPAIEYANGTKFWCLNNKCHREDGPAVEYADGDKFWCINGKQLSKTQFNARMNTKPLTLKQISEKFNIPLDQLRIKD